MSRIRNTTVQTATTLDTTALLVRMSPTQLRTWAWIADPNGTCDVLRGWEVRDTTGALLGLVLGCGQLDSYIHAEWYDPHTREFYAAGEGQRPLHGVTRVLEMRHRNGLPTPAGEGFTLNEPMYRPRCYRCHAGWYPEDCPEDCGELTLPDAA